MTSPISSETVAYIIAVAGLAAGAWERWQASKRVVRSDLEQQLISDSKVHQTRADTYSALYQRESDEHQKTRTFWHDKSSEFQVTLGKCQEQILEYKSKPDYEQMLALIMKIGDQQQRTLNSMESTLQSIRDVLAVIHSRP